MPEPSKRMVECDSVSSGARAAGPAASISGLATRGILVGFSALGLDPDRLCAPLDIAPSELMDPGARVSSETFASLWRQAERQSGDPQLGLHLAESIPVVAAGGLIGQLAAVSETGLDAVRHLARYHRVLADRLRIALREDDPDLAIDFDMIGNDDEVSRHVYEALLGGCWRVIDAGAISNLRLTRVSFRHSPPSNVGIYERFFGCPVEFRAATYSLHLPLASIREPMIATEPRAESRLRTLLESELRALAPEFTVAVSERVRAAIEDEHGPTQTSIAKRMGIGERTLQRRLREEGSSFRLIVDLERQRLALEMLRDPKQRVIDVAHALGYEDATSFSKAFRRWTGTSPAALRARARDRST